MNILITGGGGYIGSVLVGNLLREGHAVTVVDNLLHRTHGLYQYCEEEGFDFVCGDARDETLMHSVTSTVSIQLVPKHGQTKLPAKSH